MNNLKLKFPLKRPHTGVVLANGNMGAMVWGEDSLNITLGQNDFWDHRGGELLDDRDSYAEMAAFAEKTAASTH